MARIEGRRNEGHPPCEPTQPEVCRWRSKKRQNARRRSAGKATEGIARPVSSIRTPADKQSELLDVELLDVFAQIEALLRCGREVQREALRVRGLPDAVSPTQRIAAGRAIRGHLNDMTDQCRSLMDVLDDLKATASQLEKLLEAEASAM